MIKNSILWGNNAATYPESSEGASISYSCVRGGISGEGNMDVDPRLLTSPGIPKLQFNSPCIDAGTLLGAPSVDIEGNPKPQGMGVDMGAYEEGVQDEDWVTLTINIVPAGAGITRPPEGQYIFERGDIARIAAQNMGGLFAHWTGDVSMDEPEISFVMDGDKTVAAVFSDNIYFVNINSIDPNPDGRSWETAFSSLQDAVNMAEEDGGGEVWVAAGTYTATTDTMLTMREGVALYGGFSGVEASRDKRNWKTSPTLFRGSIYGADRAILDGFHITGGYSEYVGGGMYIRYVSPIIRNCLFTSNSAYHGGAIYITYGASPHISNCSFIANNANADGGAVYIDYYCTAQFTNCYFDNNRASHHGGAVFSNWLSFPYFYHCTFRQNVAGIGGGIWAWDSVLRNCILWGNVNWAGGDDEISCEGTSMVTFSCIFGGFDGIDNIDLDPLFSGGYKLQSGSPCIDAGTSEGAPDTDIEGIPRPQGKGWDMGAYEYAPIVVILAGEAELVLACDAPYVEAGLASVLDIRDGEVVDLVEPASVPVLIWQQAALLYTSNLMYIENDFNNPDVIARPIPPKQEAYTLSYEVTGSTGDPGTATRIVHLECPLTEEGEAEEGETPIEGEGEKLTEGEGEIPAEGEALPEDEGETPAEGEGEVLPEGEGETPAEGEGEALPEGEGETPAEGEGEVLPEGEGETPTEGEGEALPEGEGETRAEGEGEALPEGEGEISAEGEAPGEGEGEPEEEPGCGCSGCDGHDKLLDAPRHFLGNWLLIGLTLLVCCWEFQRFRN